MMLLMALMVIGYLWMVKVDVTGMGKGELREIQFLGVP